MVQMYGRRFPCLDGGFAPNEAVDVVIRPEDIDIVPVEQGQLTGTVTSVTFKGMQYDIIVDFQGFKWLIQTTDHCPGGRPHRHQDRSRRHPRHEEERTTPACSAITPPSPRNTTRLDDASPCVG